MKKIFAIMLALTLCLGVLPYAVTAADGDVAIDEVNFPDAEFRKYVTTLDGDGNGFLSVYECNISNMDLGDQSGVNGIKDLTGIEHFTALTDLNLTSQKLTELDVSMLTNLETLECQRNQISDISRILVPSSISFLGIANNGISELDLSSFAQLKVLHCSYNNLTSLSLDGMTKLEELGADGNNLTSIDLSGAPALNRLDIHDNQITELSVENNPNLKNISADNNLITELDLSKQTKLDYVHLSNNPLEKLTLGDQTTAKRIFVNNTNLTSLDLDGFTAIDEVQASGNTRRVVVVEDGEIDMSALGNVAKMSNLVGGTLSGNILTVANGTTTVTYDYNTGYKDTLMTVTLNIVWGENHCVCGTDTAVGDHSTHSDIIFTPWFDATSMPTEGGSYVLADDVTVPDTWEVTEDTTLCLGGQTLTGTGDAMVIFVNSGVTLTICDCQEIQGKITGGKEGGIYAAGDLNLYGGEITGNGFTQPFGCGGGIYSVGSFNMYGGKIWDNTSENGGGVYQIGTFNMYGGHICQNISTNGPGGGVSNGGTFNMYGGTVHNNFGAEGGGIAVFEKLNMYGGEIYLNTGSICGGGIASKTMRTAGIINLYGGTVERNTSPMGGGIYNAGELSVYGGTVTDNEITNLYFKGGTAAKIDVTDTETEIGITYGKGETGIFGIGGKDSIMYFFSDTDGYDVAVNGDDLEIVPHAHKWGDSKYNGDGTHTHTCSEYNTHTETVACSAADDGDCSTAVICACGNELTAAKEHSWTLKCDKDGQNHTIECINDDCDCETDAPHAFDNETQTHLCAEADCEQPASYFKTCDCGRAGTESFTVGTPNGHGETEIRNAKEATTTEAGYTGDTYCKACDKLLESGTETPKLAPPITPATGDSGVVVLFLMFIIACTAATILLGKRKA